MFRLPEVNITSLDRAENLTYVLVKVNDLSRCSSLILHSKTSVLKLSSGLQQVRYVLLDLLSCKPGVIQSVRLE